MKEKLGYRETQIEDKVCCLPSFLLLQAACFQYEEHVSDDEGTSRDPDDIRNMKEGERPAVVVLDPKSDITVEELDVEVLKKRDEDERRMIEEGKITFKKPEKRPLAKSTKPEANTNANSQSEENKSNEQSDEGNKPAKIPPPPPPQQSNARLLSFGDDEDNE